MIRFTFQKWYSSYTAEYSLERTRLHLADWMENNKESYCSSLSEKEMMVAISKVRVRTVKRDGKTDIQSILIINRVKFFVTPKINSPVLSCNLQTCEERWNIWIIQCTHYTHTPNWWYTRWCSALFQLSYCKQASSSQSTWCHFLFFARLCYLLVILLFKMTTKCRTEMLPSVPEYKKAVTCLPETQGR